MFTVNTPQRLGVVDGKQDHVRKTDNFYPRPVSPFAYCRHCRCLRLSVCVCVVCVRQPRACPRDNLSLIQLIQNHKIWTKSAKHFRSLLFGGFIDLDLQGQIERKSKIHSVFGYFYAITHHQFNLGFPNLENASLTLLLLILGLIYISILTFNFIFNFKAYTELSFLYSIYFVDCHWLSLMRPSLVFKSPHLCGVAWNMAETLGEWTAIEAALCHRLFHSAIVSWCDHFGCATGRRPFWVGSWVWGGIGWGRGPAGGGGGICVVLHAGLGSLGYFGV